MGNAVMKLELNWISMNNYSGPMSHPRTFPEGENFPSRS